MSGAAVGAARGGILVDLDAPAPAPPEVAPVAPNPLPTRTAWGDALDRALGRDPEQQYLVVSCTCGQFHAEGVAVEVLELQRKHLARAHGIERKKQDGRRNNGRRRRSMSPAARERARATNQARREERIAEAMPVIVAALAERPLTMQKMFDVALAAGHPTTSAKIVFKTLRDEGRIRRQNHLKGWELV